MPARTTAEQVQTLITVTGCDAAAVSAMLAAPMLMACTLIDCIGAKCPGLLTLDTACLELIERNLAAHFFALGPNGGNQGRVMKSDMVGEGVGRTWVAPSSPKGYGLKSTSFGQAAMLLDTSGCIANHEEDTTAEVRRKAQFVWIGKC